MPKRKLPKRLYIVRHARSLANEMLDEAEAAGADFFVLPMPDSDSPIVESGRKQSLELAQYFAQLPEQERPSKIVSSTHLRTRQTGELLLEHSGLNLSPVYDVRLIERHWGVIGGMTRGGFSRFHPTEAAKRALKGDFRYRPPGGGESLRDLKKRIKPALEEHLCRSADENLVLLTHSQVILVMRHLLEKLNEKQTLELDDKHIPNCSVCVYVRRGRRLVLEKEYLVAS